MCGPNRRRKNCEGAGLVRHGHVQGRVVQERCDPERCLLKADANKQQKGGVFIPGTGIDWEPVEVSL